ncbi:unnamed protein product [Larinioides sclopetarius]|uniref:Uncharacterized protein n=1 Tax=Larinioides sclopetarius TaxID=280406 RepID=A0AAV2C005_9ARAC
MEELFLDFCILVKLQEITMAGPLFWNVKEEYFQEHLEGLHRYVLRLPENQQREIILSCHNLEPEKFVPDGQDLEVNFQKLKRSTLWVVDRKTVIFGREDKVIRRPHPVVQRHTVKIPSQTAPPVVPSTPPTSPRLPLTLVFRKQSTSNGISLYSVQFKDKRMQRLVEMSLKEKLEDESQEKEIPVPLKRKSCDAGSSIPVTKKPRLQMMDPRMKRFMNKKPKVLPNKGDDDKRSKELVLKARLQILERQKRMEHAGGADM